MTEPEDFTSLKGATIPRKISVDYISFSAHVDYSQNSEFIEAVRAQHVVSPPLRPSPFSFLCFGQLTSRLEAGTLWVSIPCCVKRQRVQEEAALVRALTFSLVTGGQRIV